MAPWFYILVLLAALVAGCQPQFTDPGEAQFVREKTTPPPSQPGPSSSQEAPPADPPEQPPSLPETPPTEEPGNSTPPSPPSNPVPPPVVDNPPSEEPDPPMPPAEPIEHFFQYLEAESKSATGWRVTSDSRAVSNRCLMAVEYSGIGQQSVYNVIPQAPSSASTVRYDFVVPYLRPHSVWIRVQTPNYLSDSVFVRFSGSSSFTSVTSGWRQISGWYWRRLGTYALQEGTNSIYFGVREAGFKLDRILVTSDTDFVPQ